MGIMRTSNLFALFLIAGAPMPAIHVATAWGGTAGSERVPFVPCEFIPSFDGDYSAPKDRGQAPVLPRPVAHKLAYYAGDADVGLAVLAPRGWHCREYIQSGGSTLVVTPEPHSVRKDDRNLTGPGILLQTPYAGTGSGASAVAEVAARLFPTKKELVQQYEPESSDFPFGPYPDDILTRRSDTDVEFETPANKDGMGTRSAYRFVKNADPSVEWQSCRN